jgi:hypothetical protein
MLWYAQWEAMMLVDGDGDGIARGPRHMWDVGGVAMEEGGGQRIKGKGQGRERRAGGQFSSVRTRRYR